MIKCTERSGVYQAVKRLFDILASLAALVVLSPLFLVIAILILSEDGRPVFYKHTRVGKGGKTFQMYKFRTMYQDRRIVLTPEQQVELQQEFKLENDPRVTRIGSKLRMSSLDELPQLLNILKGDMSFVGPRPIMEREFEFYTPAETAAFQMLPRLQDESFRPMPQQLPSRPDTLARNCPAHPKRTAKQTLDSHTAPTG